MPHFFPTPQIGEFREYFEDCENHREPYEITPDWIEWLMGRSIGHHPDKKITNSFCLTLQDTKLGMPFIFADKIPLPKRSSESSLETVPWNDYFCQAELPSLGLFISKPSKELEMTRNMRD